MTETSRAAKGANRKIIARTILLALVALTGHWANGAELDLAINHGRVMDPMTGTDKVMHVGVRQGRIVELSEAALAAERTIDASGLVVAPGFIDLHAHGQDPTSNGFQVTDGVTTALELEIGVLPVDTWLESMRGKSRVHYGATASHLAARMQILTGMVVGNPIYQQPASSGFTSDYATGPLSPEQAERLVKLVDQGVRNGGLGIGIGITYTPGASHEEIYSMFRLASHLGTPVFTHIRNSQQTNGDGLAPLQEVLANATASGAALHVVHINSSMDEQAPLAMELIRGARRAGVDVTTESYPYTAGSTRLESALFDNWQGDYGQLQWTVTGERLTRETFEEYRKTGGWVIIHGRNEVTNHWLISQPDIMVASDGVPFVGNASHPRGAGTFARVLGHYVRDEGALDLMSALHKMTAAPAKRLEKIAPIMARKGRIQTGADADITIFDPATILDQATYTLPARTSIGIEHVLVKGTAVVADGRLVEDAFPGEPIRSAISAR